MRGLDDPRVQEAIAEIEGRIRAQYPEATFEAFEGEDPRAVYVYTWTHTDDDFAVMDVVVDYLSDLLIDEEIFILVVPFQRVPALS